MVPLRRFHFFDGVLAARSLGMNTSVVDQDIDAAQALFDGPHERGDLLLIRQVDDVGICCRAGIAGDAACYTLDVRRSIDKDACQAGFRKSACRGRAYADRGAGDDRNSRFLQLRHGDPRFIHRRPLFRAGAANRRSGDSLGARKGSRIVAPYSNVVEQDFLKGDGMFTNHARLQFTTVRRATREAASPVQWQRFAERRGRCR